ncbi:hypothetical protein NPX13_g9396 [Xylaria arbuscula]|uniref:Uncharacterized protein n=1 Tax=Xylaria arbuscula TaxID=114810 RepID=A0A9W8N6S8_9PEZI|nr:hypothetical protein NPX13_g9396 [Xylaria arbuscula]
MGTAARQLWSRFLDPLKDIGEMESNRMAEGGGGRRGEGGEKKNGRGVVVDSQLALAVTVAVAAAAAAEGVLDEKRRNEDGMDRTRDQDD